MLWGLRVVIPGRYRVRLLDDLHQEHHGICRVKSLARGYFWWPGLDADIVEMVQQCHVCAALGKSPPGIPLYPWKLPAKPWDRIHIDFFERGKLNFLIVVHATFKKIMLRTVGNRDHSIQEVMHHLLSLKYVSASFDVITASLDGTRKVNRYGSNL